MINFEWPEKYTQFKQEVSTFAEQHLNEGLTDRDAAGIL